MKPGFIAALVVGILVLGGVALFILSGDSADDSMANTAQQQVAQTTEPQTQPIQETETERNVVPKEYTIVEVAEHNTANDCWTVINGSVYDISSYVNRHPGGDAIELACGGDGTSLFTQRETADGEQIGSGTSHSPSAFRQLESFFIGTLAE